MDAGILYQKTRKGEEEIRERRAKLPQKLRTMLILIDGSKTAGQLNVVAKQLGIAEDYIKLLEGQGLITAAGGTPGAAPAPSAPQDEVQRKGTRNTSRCLWSLLRI